MWIVGIVHIVAILTTTWYFVQNWDIVGALAKGVVSCIQKNKPL